MRFLLRILIGVIIISLFSCDNTKPKIISFNVGFDPLYIKTFQYKGEHLVYFAETTTAQSVKIFRMDGTLYDKISTDSISSLFSEILKVELCYPDTVLYMTKSYLLMTGRIGRIQEALHIDSLYKNESDYYKFSTPTRNNSLVYKDRRGKHIIYGLSWYIEKGGDRQKISEKRYYSTFFKKYHLGVYDCSTGEVRSTAYYPYMFDHASKLLESSYYMISDGKIFVWSIFSDILLVLDFDDLHLIKKIRLESKYNKLGVKPQELDDTSKRKHYLEYENGYITQMYFQPETKTYYMVGPVQLHRSKKFRNYTLMTYDENFNKTGETLLDAGTYVPYKHFLTPEGMYVMIKSKDDEDYTKIRFELIH
jgi:hypothetical protein